MSITLKTKEQAVQELGQECSDFMFHSYDQI
jgi:hypothetical protein